MYNSIIRVSFESNFIIIAEFQNGAIKNYDLKYVFEKYPAFKELVNNPSLFYNGKVAVDGSGIIFSDELDIAAEEIYESSILISKNIVDDVNLRIANMFSKAREEKKITQNELAKITGIHQAEISKIERGIGNPSIKTLQRIAKGLGLSLELFLR